MLELFGVLFITLFITFLLTLVVLNLDMMFKKGDVEKVVNEDVVESKALKDYYKACKDFYLSLDFGSNKDRSLRTRYKQKHGGTIEFIDCKWEDWNMVHKQLNSGCHCIWAKSDLESYVTIYGWEESCVRDRLNALEACLNLV